MPVRKGEKMKKIYVVLMLFTVVILSAKDDKINDNIEQVCMYPKTVEAYEKLADILTGHWTAMNHSGHVMASGYNMPIPADPKPVKGFVFFVQNGKLILTHPDIKPMVLTFTDEPNWKFSERKMRNESTQKIEVLEPLLKDEDIAMLTGCKNIDLPRLIGKTVFKLDGGQTMNATYRFMVINDSALYGFMEYSGVVKGGFDYKARRAFAFTRDN